MWQCGLVGGRLHLNLPNLSARLSTTKDLCQQYALEKGSKDRNGRGFDLGESMLKAFECYLLEYYDIGSCSFSLVIRILSRIILKLAIN